MHKLSIVKSKKNAIVLSYSSPNNVSLSVFTSEVHTKVKWNVLVGTTDSFVVGNVTVNKKIIM